MKKRMMHLLTLLMIMAAACASAASIRRGSTGSDVEELQRMLSKLGYYSGNISGHAGDKTIEAIEAFQEKNGLKKDGILIYDHSAVKLPELPATVRTYGIDALDIAANQLGSAKCANSVLMGALAEIMAKNGLNEADQADFTAAFKEAVAAKFGRKPGAVEMNIQAFEAGKAAMK